MRRALAAASFPVRSPARPGPVRTEKAPRPTRLHWSFNRLVLVWSGARRASSQARAGTRRAATLAQLDQGDRPRPAERRWPLCPGRQMLLAESWILKFCKPHRLELPLDLQNKNISYDKMEV